MRTAAERWDRYFDWTGGDDGMVPDEELQRLTFALRGDDALVIFDYHFQQPQPDEAPFFLIKTDSATGVIYAELKTGERSEIYCEPIWLSGWMDHYYYKFNPDLLK